MESDREYPLEFVHVDHFYVVSSSGRLSSPLHFCGDYLHHRLRNIKTFPATLLGLGVDLSPSVSGSDVQHSSVVSVGDLLANQPGGHIRNWYYYDELHPSHDAEIPCRCGKN